MTPEEIAALPEPAQKYIAELKDKADEIPKKLRALCNNHGAWYIRLTEIEAILNKPTQ